MDNDTILTCQQSLSALANNSLLLEKFYFASSQFFSDPSKQNVGKYNQCLSLSSTFCLTGTMTSQNDPMKPLAGLCIPKECSSVDINSGMLQSNIRSIPGEFELQSSSHVEIYP